MRPRSRAGIAVRVFLTAVVSGAASGCGSDGSGPIAPGAGDGYMTASINGATWASDPMYVDLGVQSPAGGIYVAQGTQLSGAATSVSLMLTNITGPGTYPLGTGANVAGGAGIVGVSPTGWITPLSGAAGTVTIATMTDTRVTGTFEFVAAPATGGATGIRTVTDGRFDMPLVVSGNRTPPPPTSTNVISATIDGVEWNAATVALQPNVGSLWGFSASNDQYSLTVGIAQPAGPGTYTLSNVVPLRLASVGTAGFGEEHCCWASTSSGSGSVTIETWNGTRATGTFAFTLGGVAGSGATEPIVVTSGRFDVGIP